jgi:hypothetical protein
MARLFTGCSRVSRLLVLFVVEAAGAQSEKRPACERLQFIVVFSAENPKSFIDKTNYPRAVLRPIYFSMRAAAAEKEKRASLPSNHRRRHTHTRSTPTLPLEYLSLGHSLDDVGVSGVGDGHAGHAVVATARGAEVHVV